MNARRFAAALAVTCACLTPAQASSQPDPVYGPPEPIRNAERSQAPEGPDQRLPPIEQPARPASISMIEAWPVGDGAQFGLGRFRVMEIARPRSNTERVRSPLIMERETRAIAGAGLKIRFR